MTAPATIKHAAMRWGHSPALRGPHPLAGESGAND
jgi:hypothetical protein